MYEIEVREVIVWREIEIACIVIAAMMGKPLDEKVLP